MTITSTSLVRESSTTEPAHRSTARRAPGGGVIGPGHDRHTGGYSRLGDGGSPTWRPFGGFGRPTIVPEPVERPGGGRPVVSPIPVPRDAQPVAPIAPAPDAPLSSAPTTIGTDLVPGRPVAGPLPRSGR
jgi:hypothetical protein